MPQTREMWQEWGLAGQSVSKVRRENEQEAGAGYTSSKLPSSDPLSPGSW